MAARNKTTVDAKVSKFCKKFGENVLRIREKKKMSLYDVQEAGYPDWAHLQKVEKGKKLFRVDTLLHLSKALGMEPWQLLKGVEVED